LYFFITFAGFPTAMQFSGIFLETTEFAPIIEFFPITVPGNTDTFSPSHTFSQIFTGFVKILLSFAISSGLECSKSFENE